MDELGVIIIAIVVLFLGIWIGLIIGDVNTQSHCKDYGKYASGDWMLVCTKK